jgi:hypothetical protein
MGQRRSYRRSLSWLEAGAAQQMTGFDFEASYRQLLVRVLPGSPSRGKSRTSLSFKIIATIGSFNRIRAGQRSYCFPGEESQWSGQWPSEPRTRRAEKRHRNPVALAREWQASLLTGKYSSRAELARGLGVFPCACLSGLGRLRSCL